MMKAVLNPIREEGVVLGIQNIKNIFKALVSVSDLGRGGASKIINEVEKNKAHYIVIKNNKPKAVIVPMEDYIEYNEAMEDIELLIAAENRMKSYNPASLISHEEVLKQSGLTEEDLQGIEVEIE